MIAFPSYFPSGEPPIDRTVDTHSEIGRADIRALVARAIQRGKTGGSPWAKYPTEAPNTNGLLSMKRRGQILSSTKRWRMN